MAAAAAATASAALAASEVAKGQVPLAGDGAAVLQDLMIPLVMAKVKLPAPVAGVQKEATLAAILEAARVVVGASNAAVAQVVSV